MRVLKIVVFIVLFLFCFAGQAGLVVAADKSLPSPANSAASTKTVQGIGTANEGGVVQAIDYPLPYPGILPDSPFYFLKVARDKVMTALITDPVKKSFYLLLLSDKRLAAGQILLNTGKGDLGVNTIVNGEQYFSEAVNQAQQAKQSGKSVGELLVKLQVAGMKHQEVMGGEVGKVSGQSAGRLEKAAVTAQKEWSRVVELSQVAGH